MPQHNDVKKFARDHGIENVEALTVYAEHFGSDHDELSQFEDRFVADLDGDDSDDAMYRFLWDEYIPDVNGEQFEKFRLLAADMGILIDHNNLDRAAYDQDYVNHSGYIFRTH